MDALSPSDLDLMAKGSSQDGDLRIAEKLLDFRTEFGFPRRTISAATGINMTTITRLELGQRFFTAHSLSNYITGCRDLVRAIYPNKVKTFDKWAFELLEVVGVVEEELRIGRKRKADDDE